MKTNAVCGFFTFSYHVLVIYLQIVTKLLRSGYLLCTYKYLVIGAKTQEIIFISNYQAHGLLLQMLPMNFLTHFLILCIYIVMLNIESQYKKDSCRFKQDNTMNDSVYCIHGPTNSNPNNTHVKCVLLSASLVIIIVTCLLATSSHRTIYQLFPIVQFYHQSTQNR